MVIVIGNGIGNPSSNPGWDCSHVTLQFDKNHLQDLKVLRKNPKVRLIIPDTLCDNSSESVVWFGFFV